jgi:hypothetical protein
VAFANRLFSGLRERDESQLIMAITHLAIDMDEVVDKFIAVFSGYSAV